MPGVHETDELQAGTLIRPEQYELRQQMRRSLQRYARAAVDASVIAACSVAAAAAEPAVWATLAPQLLGIIVGASTGARAMALKEEIEAVREAGSVRLDALEEAAGVLAMEREITDDDLEDLRRRLDAVGVSVRDVRGAVHAFAEALAADDEEAARAYARAALQAIEGRARSQADAAALAALGQLTSGGLRRLHRHYRDNRPRPRRTAYMGSARDWSLPELEALTALGLVAHDVPPGANVSGSYKVTLTSVGERLVALTR